MNGHAFLSYYFVYSASAKQIISTCHKTMGWSVLLSTTGRPELLRSKLNEGDNHENRSDRWKRAHRVKARYQVTGARTRSSCRISQFRRQYPHRRGTCRSTESRFRVR